MEKKNRIKKRVVALMKNATTFSLTRRIQNQNVNKEIAEAAVTTLAAMSQAPEKFSATEIKNFYENILAKLPCIVFWKDKNFKYVFCNEITAISFFRLNSPSEVVGKTDFDFDWDLELAKWVRRTDEEILTTGKPLLNIEKAIRMGDGRIVHLSANRMPLFNSAGEAIGIIGISVDITERKEAERREAELLRLEREHQQAVLQEKEKLIALAHKVAHDISSPLSALNMMIQLCNELPENKRSVIKRANESILDIANNLLSTYRNEEKQTTGIEPRQPVLISDLIGQLFSEKKAQYNNHPVSLNVEIAEDAQCAFALLQPSQFRRSLSNLINNAVDAVEHSAAGQVTVTLSCDAAFVTLAIQDNGKGMSSDRVEKIMQRQSFTDGKQHGHGLGLQQVWDTLDHNQGAMKMHSTPGLGTAIQLTFPRVTAPDWFAQTLSLSSDSIVAILDDEESIHGAWDTRILPYLQLYSQLRVHHFKQGKDALDFFSKLTPVRKDRVIFLSDYELLRQDKNGLQIIEESGMKNTVLVTSYYANPTVRNKAVQLGIKILPKQMASIIPIEMGLDSGVNRIAY